MSDSKISVPKLTEGTYEEWAILMEAVLIAAEMWGVVGPEDEEPVFKGVKGVKEKKTKQQQARAKIVLSLDSSQLSFIIGLDDPREIWTTLRDIHRSQSVNSVLSLRRRFFRMRKLETETTLGFISRVRRAAHELSNTPAPVLELDQILVITDGLPEDYTTVVTALDSLPFSELKMSNVITRITGREAQLQRSEEKTSDDTIALVARHTYGKGQPKKISDRSAVQCYTCQGFGHIAAVCPSADSHAHIAQVDSDSQDTLQAHMARTTPDHDDNTLVLF